MELHRVFTFAAALILTICFSAPSPIRGQIIPPITLVAGEVVPLEYDKRIAREISFEEIHSYSFQREVGDRPNFSFAHKEIDLRIDVIGPLGDLRETIEYRRGGKYPIVWRPREAVKREIIRFELRLISNENPSGTYQITVARPGSSLNERGTLLREKAARLAETISAANSEEERRSLFEGEKLDLNQTLLLIDEMRRHLEKPLRQQDYARAMDLAQFMLRLSESTKDPRSMSEVYFEISKIYSRQGNRTLAIEALLKEIAIKEEIDSKADRASAEHPQGGTFRHLMYDRNGLLTMTSSSRLKRAIADRLGSVAGSCLQLREFSKAIEFADKATSVARQSGSQFIVRTSRLTAAFAYRALGRFDEALKAYEAAIESMEELRSALVAEAFSPLSAASDPYEPYIELLMQLHRTKPSEGYDLRALQAYERSRSRALLELLAEAEVDFRRGTSSEILKIESNLQNKLNELAQKESRSLGTTAVQAEAAELRKQIDETIIEYNNIAVLVRRKSKFYQELEQPKPLTLDEIQRDIVDYNTILLQFKLGNARSYLWAISKTSITSFELPPRRSIESSVRRVLQRLTSIDTHSISTTLEYDTEISRLSRTLLLPVISNIKNNRIAIVSDGILSYLPFGVLHDPTASDNGRQPLAVTNEIVTLPSASSLQLLRRRVSAQKSTRLSIAIMADPVFSTDDERMTRSPVVQSSPARRLTEKSPNKSLLDTVRDFGLLRDGVVPRLPFSRREAESIFDFAPKAGSLKALDFDADREKVLNTDLSKYRIIHFATHGILHSEHPELSGIVLSLVNEKGDSVNGFLRLNEIYNMKLNADLVVLSACQTALGKEVRGEGLIGLTRGFMYAGSPRVVASLWKVDDVATAELMKVFYQKMLKEKMRPAAALRAAKIAMMKQKRWNAPYYWAAFELQGEWR